MPTATVCEPAPVTSTPTGWLAARYHAGDVLTVTFTAKGWSREGARILIRDGRKPRVARA
jgi:hypothetical protein